jgi:dTDP-4-dehydrorhamnose reductase
MKPMIAGTGLSGMVGTRFRELYLDQFEFENWDLTTGVDILNQDQIAAKMAATKAEVLIHLAAFTNVSAAHEQNGDKQGTCYGVNVLGTEHIAKAARDQGKYLIHISTDYVFDGTSDRPYIETDTPHPIEWYGATKLMAEEKVQQYLDSYAILRLAFPYQARPMRADFLATIIEKLESNSLPPAFTDHTVTPTFVDDLANTFAYFAKHKPGGVYHAVGSSWHTDYEMATMVKDTFNLEGDIRKGSLQEYSKTIKRPYQKTMKVSNAKLQKDIGIKMKTFEEGLEAIVKQLA